MAISYKDAGVNINAGEALVDWLIETQPKSPPHADKLLDGIGGFASLFRADFKGMDDPVLVSCTDGTGTKLKIAQELGQYQEVGIDLVAMCINDLVCSGATPLFFLDYFATGSLDLDQAKQFLTGVRSACAKSNCILIGGETAEMPGMYNKGEFDCAGFAVGVVDRSKIWGRQRVKDGSSILAVESSGFHSNGFSLLRKVYEGASTEKLRELLTPTHLYNDITDQIKSVDGVQAIAHITGGGVDNILRVVPKEYELSLQHWAWPEKFRDVQAKCELPDLELMKVLNCGLGLAIILDDECMDGVAERVKNLGYDCWKLGEVKDASGTIRMGTISWS